MIAYLQGQVIKKTEKGIILSTGSVGYQVHLDKNTFAEIDQNTEKEFFIYSHVREEAFDLYGFEKYENLEFFKQLISVSGIGPKVALEILSAEPAKIKSAIANEDSAYISKVPGIGAKTAKRLILELKSKIEIENLETLESAPTQANDEAIEALIKLGYQRHHVLRSLKGLPDEIIEAEAIITYFLKNA